MSTSPCAAPARAREKATAFPYDSVSPADVWNSAGSPGMAGGDRSSGSCEIAVREAQARTEGRQEGEAEARRLFAEQLAGERAAVSTAVAQFARDRERYFQEIEAQVVQLALSMARKILHREAQMDPLLLAGIVRVALDNIDGATRVRLRVHSQNAADWSRFLKTQLEPSDLPEIVEDPAQPLDECTLETSMGTARIGLEAQLKEIEQGLMDLLASRPGGAR